MTNAEINPARSQPDARTPGTRPPTVWRRLASVLDQGLTMVALVASLQVLLTWLAALHPAIELAAHFSMHSLVITLAAFPLAVLRHRKWLTIVLILVLCGQLSITRAWSLLPVASEPPVAYGRTLRVMSWNLLFDNPALSSVDEFIAENDPDVLVLIELEHDVLESLSRIRERYPYRFVRPGFGGAGIAMFSKIKGTEFSTEAFSLTQLSAIVARLPGREEDKPLRLIAMHTLSPMPPWRAAIRDSQLAAFLKWSKSQAGPLCICGDLNITPWAPAFRLIEQSGFVDSRVGSGNCPSWPTVLGFLGIPIDHALYRGQCQILDRRVVYQANGSDHFPILFTIRY